MINKKKFKEIIKLASQPIEQDLRKVGKEKADNYRDKQIHQRKVAGTSGKHSDKSHWLTFLVETRSPRLCWHG